MSTAHIEALMRSAEKDRALAHEMRYATSLERLVEIGAARGYRFTKDELDVYLERLPPPLLIDDELDDDELAMVTAGMGGLSAPAASLQMKASRCFVKSWSGSGDAD
jgi:predicted ribosomally synthesized peptide with nif11-like leader